MKRIGFLIFAFALLVVTIKYVGAVSESEQFSQNTKKYINQEKRYSIEYPKDWQKKEVPRLDIVLFSPSKDEQTQIRASINIVSEKVGDEITLDQFYTESIKHLKTELQDVRIEETNDLSIHHIPSKQILYTHEMQGNQFRVLQYFLVAQGHIYLLTFNAIAQDFKTYRSLFENIANSFLLLIDNE